VAETQTDVSCASVINLVQDCGCFKGPTSPQLHWDKPGPGRDVLGNTRMDNSVQRPEVSQLTVTLCVY